MLPPISPGRSRRWPRPAGRVNFVSLLVLAAIAGGIYWVIIFSPVYLDNLDVKEAISVAYNQVGKRSPDQLRAEIKAKLNDKKLGWHREDDGYGNVTVVGGLGIQDEQIFIERNDVTNEVLIRVEYEREVVLKPTERVRFIRFSPQKEGPIPSS